MTHNNATSYQTSAKKSNMEELKLEDQSSKTRTDFKSKKPINGKDLYGLKNQRRVLK